MRQIKIKGHKIELYDAIDELPVKRFHKFNKYMLVDAGIGSDYNDVNSHILKINAYIDKGDSKNAKQELENMRESLFMIIQEISPKHLSFVLLIRSIDGDLLTDVSDENIKRLFEYFNKEKTSLIEILTSEIKKKLDSELELYFTNYFDATLQIEYYELIKSRTKHVLDSLIEDKEVENEIRKIDILLAYLAKPKKFIGKESAEIAYEKQFEDMCLFLQSEVKAAIDTMTVLQFYNAFQYIKRLKKSDTKTNRNGQSNKI